MSAMPAFVELNCSLPSIYILHCILCHNQLGWKDNTEQKVSWKTSKFTILAKYEWFSLHI